MKILFIQPCYENFGGYFRTIGLAKALGNKGIKVDLLCPTRSRFYFFWKKKDFEKNLRRWELPRWEIGFFINGRLVRGIISSLMVLFGQHDLIHAFGSTQLETVIPFFVAKLLKKKTLFDWDDYWQDSPFFHKTKPLLKRYISFLENMVPKHSEYMTVTSEFLKKEAKKLGSKQVLKIINGVDLMQIKPIDRREARKRLKIGSKEKMILSFGNTYEGERAYLLLKTFSEVVKIDPTVKLYFRFNPELFYKDHRIKKEISKKILKNIIVTGFIKNELLPHYLASADLMLFLMGNSPGERACFPIRVGTYLAGDKVIAMNKTETEVFKFLDQFNCVLTGRSPSEVAREIIRFFNHKDFARKIKTNVLKAKKELSWDSQIIELVKFYRSLS